MVLTLLFFGEVQMIAAMGAAARMFLVCGFVLFSCFALGQDTTKDQKPKDGKETAVEYMLGEPDRLLAEFSKSMDRLAKTKAASFFGKWSYVKLHITNCYVKLRIM